MKIDLSTKNTVHCYIIDNKFLGNILFKEWLFISVSYLHIGFEQSWNQMIELFWEKKRVSKKEGGEKEREKTREKEKEKVKEEEKERDI